MKGTFLTLNPQAKLFEGIRIHQPNWWKLISNDKDLYVEIRKDNYINVYYYGGLIAKISYKKDFVAETHQKYLGNEKPYGKDKNGKIIFKYEPLDLKSLDEIKISEIKNRIETEYLKNVEGENPAEKWLQGKMINKNPNYIDSEFQFNQDSEIGKLRIDLIELSNGILSFVELKGIFDNRLRNDEKRNSEIPEIIDQMKKYELFIKKYEIEIKTYYQKLIEIKQSLGLTKLIGTEISINKIPKLIIANTYKKMTIGREQRISDIKKLLDKYRIDYEIIK